MTRPRVRDRRSLVRRAVVAAVLVAAVVVALGAASAAAQGVGPLDHLGCYRIKAGAKVKGLVDLFPNRDCKIRGPVLFCAPVTKANVRVEPPPPGADAGPRATDHLCYQLKCPKPLPSPLVVSDQLGSFSLRFSGTSLLCTPAVKGTPTTSTVTTTTTTTTATTTTLPCHFEAATNGCAGGCPLPGQQCMMVEADRCDCVPPACRTCYLTVADSCTATPCSSLADCTEPNTLCLSDRCAVVCPQ